ncbi:hypothetical protein D3C77_375910 [compost metagenome]
MILLSAILLSGCASDNSEREVQGSDRSPVNNTVTTELEQENNGKRIAASEKGEVKIFAMDETADGIKGVTLNIQGRQTEFGWEIIDTGTNPQVFYTDLTGDGKEEAAVIIQTGRGTGLDTYDIHAIKADDLSEIKVQSAEDIVAQEIESRVVKNDNGTLAITVKTQGKEYNFDSSFDPAPEHNQEKLNFGGVIIYYLENQKIKLNLPGSVGITPHYVCDINVIYIFDSVRNEFIVDQIEVKPSNKEEG